MSSSVRPRGLHAFTPATAISLQLAVGRCETFCCSLNGRPVCCLRFARRSFGCCNCRDFPSHIHHRPHHTARWRHPMSHPASGVYRSDGEMRSEADKAVSGLGLRALHGTARWPQRRAEKRAERLSHTCKSWGCTWFDRVDVQWTRVPTIETCRDSEGVPLEMEGRMLHGLFEFCACATRPRLCTK